MVENHRYDRRVGLGENLRQDPDVTNDLSAGPEYD